MLAANLDAWAVLPAMMPRQIIHVDYVVSNVLLQGSAVSGVLDFEFAAPDYRAMELAGALSSFALGNRLEAADWPLIEALTASCFTMVRFREEELRSMPVMLMRRYIVSFIHRAGRWREGLSSREHVIERWTDLMWLQAWLASFGSELVDRLIRVANYPPSA